MSSVAPIPELHPEPFVIRPPQEFRGSFDETLRLDYSKPRIRRSSSDRLERFYAGTSSPSQNTKFSQQTSHHRSHSHHHFSHRSPSSVNGHNNIPPISNASGHTFSQKTKIQQERIKRRSTSFIGFDSSNVVEDPALCAILLTAVSVILVFISLPFSLFCCIKVVQEYERAVIFRLGRLLTGGARGPGIFFIIPCIDTYSKVDLRTVSFDVPPQEILSKDSVTVTVDAVVYFRISNAIASVSNVEDYARSTRLLAATTLRNVLGTKNLSDILSERESISHMIQSSLDEATDSWGVKVERVEIKDVRLPVQLQRAMAAEAEATREARAKVIAAEGEKRASQALKAASEVIACSPAALQLRYLQTLNSIAAERNSTIVFPVPMEIFRGFLTSASSSFDHSTNLRYIEHSICELLDDDDDDDDDGQVLDRNHHQNEEEDRSNNDNIDDDQNNDIYGIEQYFGNEDSFVDEADNEEPEASIWQKEGIFPSFPNS